MNGSDAPVLPKQGQLLSVGFLSGMALVIERARISAQVRLAHLSKRSQEDPYTAEVLERLLGIEKYLDRTVVGLLGTHPASPWFLRIKNLRGEAFCKVLAEFEGFGRFYEKGDSWIPVYNGTPVPDRFRDREVLTVNIEGADRDFVWVSAIERCPEASDLRKLAGLYPGAVAESGRKLSFNRDLRTMLWRVSENFIRANGRMKWYYDQYRAYKERKLTVAGIKILPTPRGRFCPKCLEEKDVPSTTRFCLDCGEKMNLKEEPEGIVWTGHFHNMCRRRMMQLFLDCFWQVYRTAEGLPTREPYPLEFIEGHTHRIDPEDLVDIPPSAVS